MTRSEFDDIEYFYELRNLCNDEGCSYLDDYIDGDDLDDYVDDDVSNSGCGWKDILSYLRDIDDMGGYDFYRRDGSFDYTGCGYDDLTELKNDVYEWMDSHGRFDDDEEDEDDEDYNETDDEYVYSDPETPEPDEPFKLEELMRATA